MPRSYARRKDVPAIQRPYRGFDSRHVPWGRNVGVVLTDYHLHLRPDDPDTPAERYFTAENVARYREAADAAGVAELGVSEHVYRFAQALTIWRHPFWREQACDDLGAYCEFVRGAGLRLGIECDFVPGAEERTAALLEAYDFDYVVGSVHFVGEAAIDHEGWDVWEGGDDADEIWRRYFDTLAECARCGLFDILAHPDLVKVWGRGRPLPDRDPRFYYEPAVEAIEASGIAVEISTAGLRKPVGELYPAPGFARLCAEAGAPFALSSDAHLPEQVGFGYDRAQALLEGIGVAEICVFEGRRRSLAPFGSAVGENR
jgi:histidinol-phosphatase (PHP family)